MATRRKGFTLIELLVVISIIALLIGMLLPALGEARRSARMVQDVANLNEHGKGTTAYVAEQKGRMPNTRADAAAGSGKGPRTTPKAYFASAGLNEVSNGFAISGASGLQHGHLWKWYIPVFGDYMYDAEGFDLLADVFVSPGAQWISGNWAFLHADSRGQSTLDYFGGSKFKVSNTPRDFKTPGFGLTPAFDDKDLTWTLTGSYRYTLSAIMGKSHVNVGTMANSDFFEGVVASQIPGTGGGARQSPWDGQGGVAGQGWSPWRAFVQSSQFAYPSQKVLFWDTWASNSPVDFYLDPRAQTAIVMVDGSARSCRPQQEMPGERETQRMQATGDPRGTLQEYETNGLWGVSGFRDANGQTFTPAWFVMTFKGAKGRDF